MARRAFVWGSDGPGVRLGLSRGMLGWEGEELLCQIRKRLPRRVDQQMLPAYQLLGIASVGKYRPSTAHLWKSSSLSLFHPIFFSGELRPPTNANHADPDKMRFPSLVAGAALLLASSTQAINILMANDDGFGSANLRETYRLLKKAGHNGMCDHGFQLQHNHCALQ